MRTNAKLTTESSLTATSNCIRKLPLISVVICLGIFVLGCPLRSAERAGGQARVIDLIDAEHKTAKHPDMKYYATIQSDGLQVSFHTVQGHFGSYTFPHKEFTLGEPAFLLCPGSPDLLPMRVVLTKGAPNNLNVYHDYRVEWLDDSPTASSGARIARSY